MWAICCDWVPPPTEKSQILVNIQKVMLWLTLGYSLFLMLNHMAISASYFVSCLFIYLGYRQLSYFSCAVHQLYCGFNICILLVELAVKFQNGLIQLVLDLEIAYKVSSLVFCIICIYFDFMAYKEYKAIALEVKEEADTA